MATNTALKVDEASLAGVLQQASEKLDGTEGELVLDFSSVRRIDPAALNAMQKLAGKAGDSAVKIVLRGVNVDIYKVLKLVKLAQRFSFRT